MTPQQPEQPDLSPAQDRAVRDLLAGARHTGPVPDDVAARLDATLADLLADLAAERTAGPAPTGTPAEGSSEDARDATVVPLASRRRRRISVGLVAAAAVVVGGVAVTQVLPQMSGEDAATTSEAGGGSSLDGAGPQEDGVGALSRAPRLSPGTFRRDVLRTRGLAEKGVLDTSATTSDDTSDDSSDAGGSQGVEGQAGGEAENGGEVEQDRRSAGRSPELAPRLLAARCGIDAGPGRLVVVRYDGQRALLVLRPPAGDRQRADLFPCGAAEPLRSVVLPVP